MKYVCIVNKIFSFWEFVGVKINNSWIDGRRVNRALIALMYANDLHERVRVSTTM